MAQTDGSTTKVKAKAKKKGNGSMTVTLDTVEPTAATPESPELAALKEQMAAILAKLGPVLKAAEAGASPVLKAPAAVVAAEQMKAGLEALPTSLAPSDPSPEVQIVVAKPKKKYTKKPKATLIEQPGDPLPPQPFNMQAVQVSVVPAEQSENPPFTPVITAQQVVESNPKMAGPAPGLMFGPDLSKDEAKAVEHAAAIIAGASAPGMPKLAPVGIGSLTPPQGTDLLLKALHEKILAQMKVPGEYFGVTPLPKPPVQAKTTAVVTTQYGKDASKQETSEETIEVRTFITQPAVVGLEFGLTLNLGNYESARISVTLTVPCYAEERDAAYVAAAKWVEDRITKQRDAILVAKTAPGF
jgi:hypothetical protein